MIAVVPDPEPPPVHRSDLANQLEALDLGLEIEELDVPPGGLVVRADAGSMTYFPHGTVIVDWQKHSDRGARMEAASALLAAARHCVVHG